MVVVKADACSAAGLYIPSEKAVPLAGMSVYCDQTASWYVRVGCIGGTRLLKMSARYVHRPIEEIGTIQNGIEMFIRAV